MLDLENIGDDYSKLDEQVKAIKESDPLSFQHRRRTSAKKSVYRRINDEFEAFRKNKKGEIKKGKQ